MNKDRFLLFDDKYIAGKRGFTLRVCPPETTGAGTLLADRPWERGGLCGDSCLTVLEDEGIYKMWYCIHSPEPGEGCRRELTKDERASLDLLDVPQKFIADILCPTRYYLCYAVSRDGLTWEKPFLGIYEVDGNRNNNIVLGGRIGATVFIDPTADAGARYKMIHGGSLRLPHWMKAENRFIRMAYTGIYGATSPDGIHWNCTPKPIIPWYTDTTNVCYWDDEIKKYVAYVRTDKDMIYENGKTVMLGTGHRTYRIVSRTESQDFENFPAPVNVLEPRPDEVEDYFKGESCKRGLDFYNSAAIKYPYAPETYFLFPSYFNHESDNVEIHIATSRDGNNYTRHDEALIGLRNFGELQARQLYMGVGMIEDGNRIHMYLMACNTGHDEEDLKGKGEKCVSRVSFLKDGFIGQQAQDKGEMITVPLRVPQGKRGVKINAYAGQDGWVSGKVLDTENREIPGMICHQPEYSGNHSLQVRVSCPGEREMPALHQNEVRLQISAGKATVFSFEWI
ncbi:MAG: hypothetical protein GX946_01220 [Oligosphaeraceae bacterium]|nr:hypothetical protein [Oligosphaeraceae bacterium]